MKRPSGEDRELWRRVQATVRPLSKTKPHPTLEAPLWPPLSEVAALAKLTRPKGPLEGIEPKRGRLIERERIELEARLDLHGLNHDQARRALGAFIRLAHQRGHRAVLVVTGKGVAGEGLLRRAAPAWLAEPGLRELVAAASPAHRRHGGDGALYVTLKRRG